MKRTFCLALTSVGLLWLAGCAVPKTEILVSPSELRESAGCLAVLGLNNDTKQVGGDSAFAEQLASSLRDAGFQVMDRNEAMRILSFHRIYVADIANEEEAAALGDLLGVQAVAYGTLTEYGWERADEAAGLRARATADIRIVDVENARVLVQSTITGDGRRSFGPRPAPLFAAAADATDSLAHALRSSAGSPAEGSPCWKERADTVLASLGQEGSTQTPSTGPDETETQPEQPVKLSAAQKALSMKLAAGGKFVLEGVSFTGLTANLTSASTAPLADLATVLKAYPDSRIQILGYVDALDKDAATLSSRRADIVGAKLLALGASKVQLETVGKGGADPRMPSFTEITRAKNRRIEIAVLSKPDVGTDVTRPRVKIVAAPGGQLNALQLLAKLKKDEHFELEKNVTQTRTRRPTTIYYRPGKRDHAARIARAMDVRPRARVSNKLPGGIDIYVLVGPPGEKTQ